MSQGELDQGELNLLWASTFMDELAGAGVATILIAPGSRSTPLVLAVGAHPEITSVVHLDERSAAFFALGVGKGSGRPAAVITTSGTAVANLFPAVVEAAQSETPLLLLTADRPARLRGTDANQTIDQERIFGTYPVAFHDAGLPDEGSDSIERLRRLAVGAVTDSLGPPSGPVHVNFPFEKPLHPAPTDAAPALEGRRRPSAPQRTMLDPSPEEALSIRERVGRAVRGLVVVGPLPGGVRVGRAVVERAAAGRVDEDKEGGTSLARRTGFPLLADPLSGARFREKAADVVRVDHYDLLLRDPAVRRHLRPDLVIRVGRAPTSSALNDLMTEAGADVIVLDAGGRWRDHTGAATSYVAADPCRVAAALSSEGADAASEEHNAPTQPWLDAWKRADAAARDAIDARVTEVPHLPSGAAEPVETHAAVRALPPDGVLFTSSSMPVRDIDAYVSGGRAFGCLGNRGASGIDGITSTALGSCFATGRPTLVLLGDLAFIHDLNGLIPAADLALPVVFVVINNRGGGIFHMLPIREHEPAFTRYFATPHQVNFQHAGGLYDLPFRRIPAGQVEEAVATAFESGGTHILEVRSDREDNRRWRTETENAVRARVADALTLENQSKTENR